MPRVQYVNIVRNIRITRDMRTPKRMNELRYWLKQAQRTICEIPQQVAESEGMVNNVYGDDGWFVSDTDADLKWIRFDLENRLREKAQIIIDRKSGI